MTVRWLLPCHVPAVQREKTSLVHVVRMDILLLAALITQPTVNLVASRVLLKDLGSS